VVSIAQAATAATGIDVLLAVVNGVQLVLLAWIASRGTRRRRSDR
jgi:hypothetical protein